MTEPNSLVIRAPDDPIASLCAFTVASLPSQASRRVYALRLREFIESGRPLTREGVGQWLNEMRDRQCGAATVNQARAAIRKLVQEAAARDLIPPNHAMAILGLKGDKILGQRVGNWLTVEGVRSLLLKPDRSMPKGRRDGAMLACLVGCGLRRQEICDLEWGSYQRREGRMCWLDISGKGRKPRTVPIPEWARLEIDQWREVQKLLPDGGGVAESERGGKPKGFQWGRLSILRDGERVFGRLTANGVWWLVTDYGEQLGIRIRPHDLRRTLARLMRTAGVDMEQISQILGHAHIETTRLYMGGILELGLQKAGVDRVEWDIGGEKPKESKVVQINNQESRDDGTNER